MSIYERSTRSPLQGLRMNSPTVDRRAVLKRRKCRGKLNQPSPAKDAVVECPRIPRFDKSHPLGYTLSH